MSRIADALRKTRGESSSPEPLGSPADAADLSMWASEDPELPPPGVPRRQPGAGNGSDMPGSPAAAPGVVESAVPSVARVRPFEVSTSNGGAAAAARLAEPPAVAARRATVRPLDDATREAVKALTRQLFLAGAAGSVRRVLFTPVDDSAASADVAVHIAEALAEQAREPVFLLDLDLSHPGFDREFGLQNQPGFSDAVCDAGDLAGYSYAASSPARLRVVPAGQQTAKVRSLFGDAATRSRVAAMIAAPAYVVAQTAAIKHHRDAGLLGGLFDGVVLVLQASSTTPQATREAAEAVKASGARLLGTILDNRVA